MTTVAAPCPAGAPGERASEWRERSARLYEELRRPARAMIRRAFRGAFGDDEVDDIYSSAWLGTLRALERRHDQLSDEEIRKYVLTAVAHHASKELRRRSRRPTAPLEAVLAVADDGASPDERAASLEESRIARDLLGTLPPRRRAVMLLRYGWGLEPRQICGLVTGLSPRAYRKEITRGVDELTEKLRILERGEWCADREPVLKAYASGLADAEQQRQAQQHLSHCRHCADFVGRLSGHLHDIGASLAVPSAVDGMDGGRFSLPDRVGDLVHRVRESAGSALGGGGGGASETAAQAATVQGSARGAGVAGTGVLAKVAGLGTAGKLAAVCLGSGAAVATCMATGVLPGAHLGKVDGDSNPAAREIREAGPAAAADRRDLPALSSERQTAPAAPDETQPRQPGESQEPTPQPEPVEPVEPSTPPVQQQFGVAAVAAPSSSGGGGSSTSGGGGDDLRREFGP